jgi:hypothetical protein
MSVDLRTRRDDEVRPVDPAAFFASALPEALERSRERIEPGAALRRLRPLSIEVDGEAWTLAADAGHLAVRPGTGAGARLRLSAEALSDLVNDQCTPMTFFTSGRLDMPAGGLRDFLDWWLVLRGALDDRPLYTPGAVDFRSREGAPLNLHRSFALDEDLGEMRHFLGEAGFLHLERVFSEEEMAAISRDMDRAAPSYRDGDGQSWWATLAGGERRVVRMQSFDRHSRATAALLEDPRFARLGDISGDGHTHQGLESNRIEALFKPIGVVAGISDVPWHKDCSLGRHSYECCSITAGISVTGAGPTSGQLGVVPGSHRALVWPALAIPDGLPELALPTGTGDVTLHLSCTLHKAHPPVERERRVMYTGFRLPAQASEATLAARRRLRAVREGAPRTVSQEPSAAR